MTHLLPPHPDLNLAHSSLQTALQIDPNQQPPPTPQGQQQQQPPPPVPSTFGGWGASVGSFFSQRAARLSVSSSRPPSIAGVSRGSSPAPPPVPPVPSNKDVPEVPPEDEAILQPRNLDEVYQHQHKQQEEEQQHQQHQHPELDAALATALAQDPVKAKVKDSDAISTISSGDTGFAM